MYFFLEIVFALNIMKVNKQKKNLALCGMSLPPPHPPNINTNVTIQQRYSLPKAAF